MSSTTKLLLPALTRAHTENVGLKDGGPVNSPDQCANDRISVNDDLIITSLGSGIAPRPGVSESISKRRGWKK